MCVVQALVPIGRETLMQVAHYFEPHLIRVEVTSLDACDGFHVGRYAFFNPMMILGHGRERKVNHLMRQHPIAREAGSTRLTSYVNCDEPAIFSAKSLAAAHTLSICRHDAE